MERCVISDLAQHLTGPVQLQAKRSEFAAAAKAASACGPLRYEPTRVDWRCLPSLELEAMRAELHVLQHIAMFWSR